MGKLNPGRRISKQFSRELEEVRTNVLLMGGIVEEQLELAVTALVNGDRELAQQVVRDDYRVNALEVEIDEECTRILAMRQPAASDLRLVMAVIKTITDLERIGDEAKRVAKMVVYEIDGSMRSEVRQEMEHIGSLVREQLRMVLDAFARTDVEAAVKVHEAGKRVDDKYVAVTRQLMTYMAQDADTMPSLLSVLWAARAMERMGDRCENIGEYVFYLVHGRDIRNTSIDEALEELDVAAATPQPATPSQ
jgi:phosphate transport system protein